MADQDTTHCPLCRQPNQCAMAAGQSPAQCWCMTQPVADTVLQQLPPEERGHACICPHCAQPRANTATI
ncbi:MAG: cysteine-rich CWC family protein [Proteobacteria bacterium]|nr:cysteine-rich CWC family protein [Pseudomonadota bacterium]